MTFLKISPLFLVPIFFLAASGYGQETERRNERQIEELAESLSTLGDESADGSLLLEDLSYYSNHPICINKATEEELSRLSLLNFKQVRCIIAYREKYGPILTLKELSVLSDFSEELLMKLEPFVSYYFEQDSLQRRKQTVLNQFLLARVKGSFPTAAGFSPKNGQAPVYSGSPYSYLTRYRGEVGKSLEFGMTAENDAGEDFFRQSNKSGFDFLSGFICRNGNGFLRKIIVGDYHLRFGQGVNLWSGGGVSYASDLSSLMRTGEGIRPYSSTDENLFFRGAAVQIKFKSVQLSVFYSDKPRDANLAPDSTGNNLITSFRMDGLHRTLLELESEKIVSERMYGIYSDFRFDKWRFGLLANCLKFGLPVSKGVAPYKSTTFEGVVNSTFGVDYHLIMNQLSFFGEAGLSQNMKPAIVNGVVWKAHPQLSLSFQYRYYDPAFQSFNSGAFAEGSGTRNENGLFAAFEFFPVAKLKISGQSDLFYFPWMTYQTISPSNGYVLAFQAEMALRPDLKVYYQSRYVCKPQKSSGATGIPEQWDEITSKSRLHCDWKLNDFIQLRTRIEYVGYQYNGRKERGYLFFQDFICTASQKLKCWYRIAWYHTDGYNSSIAAYENDLLYYFAIPSFFGAGIRSYLNLKWQPLHFFSFYLKAGYTLRAGATLMSSGNDATQGDHRFDFRGQICLRF
jgi:hypothetical protein